MRLNSIDVTKSQEHVRLIGRVACREPGHRVVPWAINEDIFVDNCHNGKEVEIYFEFPRRYEDIVTCTADPFAVALLLPSMAAGEPLEITQDVSELLLFNLLSIRDIFHTWYPQLFERIPIIARPRREPSVAKTIRAASFFSGGVDSFYTLLKRLNREPLPAPLTHIIFMRGIEQRLEDSAAADASQFRAEQIAYKLGIECISGKTNLRTLLPLHWDRYYVGSGLAATALTLSAGFNYICIPSSYRYNEPILPEFTNSTGSTPFVDERFSTETLRIVHDGSEAGRAEKTRRILEWNQKLVLENLRVCFENSAGITNCCRCYKCVRTAVALKILGLFEQASTFPDKSTDHWRKTIQEDHPIFVVENLALSLEFGTCPQLSEMLGQIVREQKRHIGLALYIKNSPLRHLLPLYRRLREWSGVRT